MPAGAAAAGAVSGRRGRAARAGVRTFFSEKYRLGVERKQAFRPWACTSATIASMVGAEYQYWFRSPSSPVFDRNRFIIPMTPPPPPPARRAEAARRRWPSAAAAAGSGARR